MSQFILFSILLALLLVGTCQSAPAVQPLESSNKQPSASENQARELKFTHEQINSESGETEKRSYGGGSSYSNSYQPVYLPPQVYYQNYPVVKHRPYYQNKPIVIPVPQPELRPVPVIVPVYKPCKSPSTAPPVLVHYYKDNKDKVNKMLLTAMNYGNANQHQQLEGMASKNTLAKNNNMAHHLEQM